VISFLEIYAFRLQFPNIPSGGSSLYDLTGHKGRLLNAWFATSVLINAMVTATVAVKRIPMLRKAGVKDTAPQPPLTRTLLVEAALPPAVCVLAVAIAYAAQNSRLDLSATLACRVWAALWLASSVRFTPLKLGS
jgi:hypothetical protein